MTWGGRQLPGRAEAVEDLPRKRQLVTEHPFFPPAPSAFLNRLLRPVLVPMLRRWVTPRPVVVIHCPIGLIRSSQRAAVTSAAVGRYRLDIAGSEAEWRIHG